MPDDDLRGRAIHNVLIKTIRPVRHADTLRVGGDMMISLNRPDGKPDGPFVEVRIGTEIDASTSIPDAEIALLDRALQLMRRIGEEDAKSLHARWVEWSKEQAAAWDEDDNS